ncbi:C40 family peptidase [Streptomyces hoynatensis]|uniref:Glycoside hydrolase n=1 Tax=Streptomyces hoynatensis TaxID=1141874 RepID=A0A3A9ZEG4_9ACTN|nr:C40 family peptidase [Streptomyces hoynatensis]RKN46851.1 glycoside hydrolase [Streptomyces hoynatensis]
MGSHRKPRNGINGILDSPAARRGAVGVGAAALASVTLLTQGAWADDNDPTSIEEQRERADSAHQRAVEVQQQVDELYREAEVATQRYDEAQEDVDRQQDTVDQLLDQAARATDQVNEARRALGSFAAAQYRTGGSGLSDTAALLLATDPQSFFDRHHTLDRLGDLQSRALQEYTERQAEAEDQRAGAAEALTDLEDRRAELATQKETVQGRLAEARALLDQLSDEEQAELDELERLEQEEAERRAEEQRRAAEERAAQQEAARQQEQEQQESEAPADAGSQAEAAVAFAEAQLGKPYVWGATGPSSYDCSGLTQAAWRAAGVEIPRVTWDQVNIGTRVSRDQLQPGDLVFFYSDISHVGMYVGDGTIIHAPKPGDVITYESVDAMPWYAAVRPA